MDTKQWIIFLILAGVYIYRYISKTNAAAKQEAERRRQQNEKSLKPTEAVEEKSKTLEEVLAEVFTDVETKSKPFAKPVTEIQSKKVDKKKHKPNYQFDSQKVKQTPPSKKQPVPFLTEDFTLETIEPEGTPSQMMEDFIKRSQLTDEMKSEQAHSSIRKNFNLREGIIANIILNRPEY